ncbi:MAG: NfeD family protein [Bacillota bacterium]
MLKLFQVCFFTGLFYTVISFVLGQIFEFAGGGGGETDAVIDMDLDVDLDMDLDASADMASTVEMTAGAELPNVTVSPIKPIVIASFITVFGGVGIICIKKGFTMLMAFAAALALAALISYCIFRFIVVPLYRAQNTSTVSRKELKGGLAKVTLTIKGSSYGKILYKVNGNTYTAPARSVDNTDIENGANVVIIDIEKNTFLVKKIKGGN